MANDAPDKTDPVQCEVEDRGEKQGRSFDGSLVWQVSVRKQVGERLRRFENRFELGKLVAEADTCWRLHEKFPETNCMTSLGGLDARSHAVWYGQLLQAH